MKATRRSRRPRKALLPSPGKLHHRLTLVEEAQGSRARRTFIFFPEAGSASAAFPDGEGPRRGDICIAFPTLREAGETLESFLDRERPHALASAPAGRELPWKMVKGDAPARRRDPDAELEALAEELHAPNIRTLTEGELREAARGLFQTGNAFSRSVVRSALAGGELPLADEEYPRAEFASSTTGTLLIRIWRYPGEQPKPRPATDADREQWSSTFQRFIDLCLARNFEAEHPHDEDATR